MPDEIINLTVTFPEPAIRGVAASTDARLVALDERVTAIEDNPVGTGTVTSVNASGGTTGLSFSGGPVTTTGTLTLSGTLNITNGGTGATTASGARTALGLAIGTDIQALITGAATSITSSNLTVSRALVSDGSGKVSVSAVTSTELGYVSGVTSSIQTQLGNLAPKANPTFTGTVTADTINTTSIIDANSLITETLQVRSSLDDLWTTFNADALTANRTLSVPDSSGTIATSEQLAAFVGTTNITTLGTISTGTWSGSTIAVNKGGTGATDASTARSNLGLTIGSNVQAWDADLDALAALSGTNTIYYRSAANTWSPVTIGSNLSFSGGTISASSSGTVSSVDASGGTTGLSFSGGPITSSGTLTLSGTLGIANGGTGSTTASGARTALGLAIGTDIQAYDSELAAIAGLTSAADKLPYFTGSGTASLATFTSAGRDLLDDATTSDQRTTLGLAIGTNVQAWDADLDALAALSGTNTIYYRSALNTWSAVTIGSNLTFSGGTLSATASGSGTVTSVDASGGTTGLSFSGGPVTTSGTLTLSGTLAIANGGTGATDASGARTALGLAIGTNVQAYDAELAAIAGLTSAADTLPYFTGSGTAALATFTAAGRALVDDADASAQRTTLGVAIGSNVQAWDADLDALAALSGTDNIYYRSGANTWSSVTIGSNLSFSGGTLSSTGGGTPGGSNTQVQFNNAGAFGGISGITSDGTNVTAGSGNLRATSPRITTSLLDANGNNWLTQTATASAVYTLNLANAASGGTVALSSTTPTQTTSSVAGTPISITASNAVAGTSTASSAVGGSLTFRSGNGAYLTNSGGSGGAVSVISGNGSNGSGGAISITSGTGDAASNGGAITLTAGAGGNSNGTGGNIVITTNGSSGSLGSGSITIKSHSSGSVSTGGAVTIQTGDQQEASPGALTIRSSSNTDTASSRPGGALNVIAGTGSSNSLAAGTGGTGGAVTITLGNGGAASSNTSGTGGVASTFSLVGGTGGAATGTGGTHTGGAGSSLTFTSGAGGNATGASGTRTGGNSGSIIFKIGAAGTGATANGTVGSMYIEMPSGTEVYRWSTTGITTTLISTTTKDALGTTTTAANILVNTTAAAAGAQQVSPATRWQGNGWATGGSSSVAVPFQAYVLPVQGSSAPTGTWVLQSGIGGSYTDRMTVTSAGVVTAASFNSASSGNYFTSSQIGLANAVLLDGAGWSANSGLALGQNMRIGWNTAGGPSLTSPNVCIWGKSSGNLQQGAADAASPVAQTFSVQSVVAGTSNTAGADRTFTGSQGTGTGRGGSIITQTAPPTTTGSAQNSLANRTYLYGGETTLTSATDTTVATIALSASKYVGGTIIATIHADDGTDFQAITHDVAFSAVNKAGTVTAAIGTPSSSTTAASAGTLTVSWTAVASGNNVLLKCNADSSLTETTLKVSWQLYLNGDGTAGVTPA